MKHLTKLSIGAAAFMILTATTSCSKSETDTKSVQAFADCYAIITDTQSGAVSVSTSVTAAIGRNWTKATAEIAVSGFEIGGSTYPVMNILNLTWGANQLWAYASTTSNTLVTLTTGQSATISNFKFQWSDRMDIPNLGPYDYDPAFVYSFLLDNRYLIEGSRSMFNLWGTTTASLNGANSFTSEVNKIVATPDFKNMTMTVLINGAQFAEKMPALNIQLNNIPMKIVNNGESFSFDATNLIPTIADVPYEDYPCSNIHGTLNPSTGMTFTFDCNVRGMALYTVKTNPTPFGYRTAD